MAETPVEVVLAVGVGRTATVHGWDCTVHGCWPGAGCYEDTLDGIEEAVMHERETGHRIRLLVGPPNEQVEGGKR